MSNTGARKYFCYCFPFIVQCIRSIFQFFSFSRSRTRQFCLFLFQYSGLVGKINYYSLLTQWNQIQFSFLAVEQEHICILFLSLFSQWIQTVLFCLSVLCQSRSCVYPLDIPLYGTMLGCQHEILLIVRPAPHRSFSSVKGLFQLAIQPALADWRPFQRTIQPSEASTSRHSAL